jgi:hypothetical protein
MPANSVEPLDVTNAASWWLPDCHVALLRGVPLQRGYRVKSVSLEEWPMLAGINRVP